MMSCVPPTTTRKRFCNGEICDLSFYESNSCVSLHTLRTISCCVAKLTHEVYKNDNLFQFGLLVGFQCDEPATFMFIFFKTASNLFSVMFASKTVLYLKGGSLHLPSLFNSNKFLCKASNFPHPCENNLMFLHKCGHVFKIEGFYLVFCKTFYPILCIVSFMGCFLNN